MTGNFGNLEEAEAFQEILDQLNLGEMPPKGKPKPKADELKRVVAHLTQSLARARESAKARTDVLTAMVDAMRLETFNKDPFAKGSLRQEWSSSTRASSMPYSRVSKLRKAKLAEEE